MNVNEIHMEVESLPLHDHQRVIVKVVTAYHRRLRAYRKASAEAERDCEHVWTGTDTVTGEHYRRCTKCGTEKTWLSDD